MRGEGLDAAPVALLAAFVLTDPHPAAAQESSVRLDELSVQGAAPAGAGTGPRIDSVGVIPTALLGPDADGGRGPIDGFVPRVSTAGTKTATPLVETPQSITAIGQDRIATFQATNASEVFRYTPGVSADVYGAETRSDNDLTNRADRRYIGACGDPTSCFYGPDRKVIAGLRYTW